MFLIAGRKKGRGIMIIKLLSDSKIIREDSLPLVRSSGRLKKGRFHGNLAEQIIW